MGTPEAERRSISDSLDTGAGSRAAPHAVIAGLSLFSPLWIWAATADASPPVWKLLVLGAGVFVGAELLIWAWRRLLGADLWSPVVVVAAMLIPFGAWSALVGLTDRIVNQTWLWEPGACDA